MMYNKEVTAERRGQAAMTMVLLVGGLSMFIAIGLAFLVGSLLNTSSGYQSSERAAAAATSGMSDALLQLIRNKDFSSSGYAVPVGDVSATVSVEQDAPLSGRATIISQASVSRYKRTLHTIVAIDDSSGEITIVKSEFAL